MSAKAYRFDVHATAVGNVMTTVTVTAESEEEAYEKVIDMAHRDPFFFTIEVGDMEIDNTGIYAMKIDE